MNKENLENYVNNFLNFESQVSSLVSEASKLSTEQFMCSQLIKSFKLLSNTDNSEVSKV